MRKIFNRNFCFILSRAYLFQARWTSILLLSSLRIMIASFQSWVTQKHFFFRIQFREWSQSSWKLGMRLCLCSRASEDGKTSRTGRRRNKKVCERRLNCCSSSFYRLEIQLYFLSVAEFEHTLLWPRFPLRTGRSAGSVPEHSSLTFLLNRYVLLVHVLLVIHAFA